MSQADVERAACRDGATRRAAEGRGARSPRRGAGRFRFALEPPGVQGAVSLGAAPVEVRVGQKACVGRWR